MISDECAGCTKEAFHFDLSGKAFGALAKRGKGDELRNLGELKVRYKRYVLLVKFVKRLVSLILVRLSDRK